jgi:DNA-binding HxlR family transcriptional regulator
MGRTADYSNQNCSVAATLEVVGDPWTLLILRDAFLGLTRFEQWRDRLGIARNVLAYRLKTLVAEGLLERQAYCLRPPRYEYQLTDKGRDIYPVLLTLRAWGDRHIYGEGAEPQAYAHRDCGHHVSPELTCNHCQTQVNANNIVRIRRSPAEADTGIAPYAPVVAAIKPPPRTRPGSARS